MKKVSQIIQKYKKIAEERRIEEENFNREKNKWEKKNPCKMKLEKCKHGSYIHQFIVVHDQQKGFHWKRYDRLCQKCTKEESNKLNVKTSNIPKRFEFADFDKTFNKDIKEGVGILISGGVGSGKTHKLVEIMKGWIIEGGQVKFQTFGEIARKIRKSIGDNNYNEVYNEFVKVEVLVIDDIGTENNTDFMQEFIYNLVNDRYNHIKPILITTNLNSKELSELYSQRVTSRLTQMCKKIKIEQKDYRLNNN